MTSETDIANQALRLLKAGRIGQLTDTTKNAVALSDVFTQVRDNLLRKHYWDFAQKWVKLAKSSTTPVFEFDNAFPLPSDWIRTVSVHNNNAGSGTVLHREGEIDGQGAILCSADELWLRYVYRVTDPNRMAADFQTAFAYALALAVPGIPNMSASTRSEFKQEAKGALREAKHADAMGSSPARRPAGSWASSRGRYSDWRAWPS